MDNQRIVLASRPEELPQPENFRIETLPVPAVDSGQVLIEVRYAALSPWQGQRLKDFKNFTRPFEIGELIDCDILGTVVDTKAPELPVGSTVTGRLGWQKYGIASPNQLAKVEANGLDEKLWLTALSSPGLTAYTAFELFGRPMPGQTLAVTSAAGSVGSYAVQIGKLAGARVVGIAGGNAKCQHVEKTLGADAAIDHRADDFEAKLTQACPDGVHLVFDTTGGPITDAVFDNLAKYAKVLFVGRTASNNSATPHLDYVNFRQLWAREATMIGFSRYSYDERWAFAKERMLSLCKEGRIQSIDNTVDGFENSPAALRDMLAGNFIGKVLVRYS